MKREALATALLTTALSACGPTGERPGETSPPEGLAGGDPAPPLFADVTADSGVDFIHDNGASSRRYLPETMGSGVALFDYDGDGRPDLYLANSGPVGGGDPTPGRLYRNLGGFRFAEMTARAGLDSGLLGMGVAVADFDNDGDLDLFAAGVGGDRLFRNRGDGTFEEVAERLGLDDPGFGSSAAFVDVDRDGWVDLVAGRYVTWSAETDVRCFPDGERASYCTPEVYDGESIRLYRNLEGRRFEEATAAAGLWRPEGKTLGLAPLDVDRDGWPDLAVANDTVRNFLYLNRGDGSFDEVGVERGVAVGPSGAPRGAMGIDAADLTGDGLSEVVVANFSQEMSAIFRASERGQFFDDAARLGIGLPTLMSLAFGVLADDFDGDGWCDLLLLNGHIEPRIADLLPQQSYAQRPALFLNEGSGAGLREIPAAGGLDEPLVGRSLASADLDGDGDLDLVATQNGRRAVVLRNDSAAAGGLTVRARGDRSNRTAYGLDVSLVAAGRTQRRALASGRSYLAANEPLLVFGLGEAAAVDRLEARWPSGSRQRLLLPPAGHQLVLFEPPPR